MDDVRLLLTDESWETLEAVISDVKSAAGAPPETTDRLFVEAILYRARVGCPWRDVPKCFGAWDAVYNRFRRWEEIGVWKALCERLPEDGLAAIKALFIDSTVVRAHQHAAGAAAKKRGQEAQGLGRSRGGFSTKIHLAAADEDTTLGIVITPGQQHDSTVVDAVLDAVPEACPIEAAVMDKAYDSDEIRANLKEQKIKPVIPTKSNRKKQIRHDKKLYGQRNCVERLVGKLKQFRAVATRYEKLACTFLAIVHVVAAFVMAR